MKVLFDFSRRGLPEYNAVFKEIRDVILDNGHNLTNDLFSESKKSSNSLPHEVSEKIRRSISEADCVIIEGSVVSISLGYILSESINLSKPVLFLCQQKFYQKSRFLESVDSKLIYYEGYKDVTEIRPTIENFMKSFPTIKTRFNFVMNNTLDSFVLSKSRKLGVSKTEYITRLIQKEMAKKPKS